MFDKKTIEQFKEQLKAASRLSIEDKKYVAEKSYTIKGTITSEFFMKFINVIKTAKTVTLEKMASENSTDMLRCLQGQALTYKAILNYIEEIEKELNHTKKEN